MNLKFNVDFYQCTGCKTKKRCCVQERSVAGNLVYILHAATFNPGLSRDEKIRECTLVKVIHLPQQLADNYFLKIIKII
jgi:hypothetical protein